MDAVLSRVRCLAVSAVVVVAGAAAAEIWPHAWPWLIIVTAVVVAGVSPGLSALATAQQRRTNVEKTTRQGLQWTTGLALPIRQLWMHGCTGRCCRFRTSAAMRRMKRDVILVRPGESGGLYVCELLVSLPVCSA